MIHVDIWGPYKTPTHDGFRYFLTTYLLISKSNAFSILKSFISMSERQFNSQVEVIRIDNAFELRSGKLRTDFFYP